MAILHDLITSVLNLIDEVLHVLFPALGSVLVAVLQVIVEGIRKEVVEDAFGGEVVVTVGRELALINVHGKHELAGGRVGLAEVFRDVIAGMFVVAPRLMLVSSRRIFGKTELDVTLAHSVVKLEALTLLVVIHAVGHVAEELVQLLASLAKGDGQRRIKAEVA
eukprot:CAMPEP_0204000662 /NCGR_PEP_ID=MMETSP0360-20130528/15537_1 /ASSEMBLY_ACC=CAM_ASM_000342 /TAXON_ID=268821 /ORGANISM="Scrippsiella Hangoei, Strain SHTV-5" /LENGTH=163 /DNA_ID=CAMNT_0050941999 /DNA_START=60 /DNA_END=551 /DNA_ORIENTATION=-